LEIFAEHYDRVNNPIILPHPASFLSTSLHKREYFDVRRLSRVLFYKHGSTNPLVYETITSDEPQKQQ
jgi:hypothetical protein